MAHTLYTEDDLTTALAARRELIAGKRVVRMTIAGKSYEFSETNLSELRGLIAEIVDYLDTAADAPSYIVTRTSKGL